MVNERLRSLRKWRGLTQVMLAAASGVAQNYISALERGAARNPSQEVIQRLAAALDVSPTELILAVSEQPITEDENEDENEDEDVERRLALFIAAEEAAAAADAARRARGREYHGYRTLAERYDGRVYEVSAQVLVDGRPLPAYFRGVSGMTWGYVGAGPEALAYNILRHEYDESLAQNHMNKFKEEVIARLPHHPDMTPGTHLEWALTGAEIRAWLERQPRPTPIKVDWSPREWVGQPEGAPRTTVYAQFLPGRRLALELERVPAGSQFRALVRAAAEQEQRPDPAPPRLVWHNVRDVEPKEYMLFPQAC